VEEIVSEVVAYREYINLDYLRPPLEASIRRRFVHPARLGFLPDFDCNPDRPCGFDVSMVYAAMERGSTEAYRPRMSLIR
jgi:hypothetical protein